MEDVIKKYCCNFCKNTCKNRIHIEITKDNQTITYKCSNYINNTDIKPPYIFDYQIKSNKGV